MTNTQLKPIVSPPTYSPKLKTKHKKIISLLIFFLYFRESKVELALGIRKTHGIVAMLINVLIKLFKDIARCEMLHLTIG